MSSTPAPMGKKREVYYRERGIGREEREDRGGKRRGREGEGRVLK